MKKNILSMAALLMASAAVFTACSSDDNITGEQPANPTGKYTMTINASKGGDATTRALTLGRNDADTKNVLNATWDANEVVLVYQGGSQIGTLHSAASTTNETTLTGELNSAPDAGQDLTLYFHTNATPSYTGQDGTLATIASTYDFCAPATITAGSFTVSGSTVSTTSSASFGANQQAIVKFTLIDKADGTTSLNATQLVVSDGTNTYTVNPAPATSEIYVAIPGISGQTVTLTATVGSDTYTYEKTGVTFANGQYYEITVKMTKVVPSVTYTAPAIVSSTLTYNGSGQALVTAGSATGGTIYYRYDYTPNTGSASSSEWSTTVPAPTNAGTYTVYYKVEPNAGYSGGVESTSLGTKVINKANGWCNLSKTSSSGWNSTYANNTSFTITSHPGGAITWTKNGNNSNKLDVTYNSNNNTYNLHKDTYVSVGGVTVTFTSAATNNYNAASGTYTCNP